MFLQPSHGPLLLSFGPHLESKGLGRSLCSHTAELGKSLNLSVAHLKNGHNNGSYCVFADIMHRNAGHSTWHVEVLN